MVSLGYLAGFLDADGTIGIYKNLEADRRISPYYQLNVSISNTNRKVLEILRGEFGGSIRESPKPGRKKIPLILQFGPVRAEAILRQILPCLIVKKQQAVIALSLREEIAASPGNPLSAETLERREAFYREIRFLNSGWRFPG